MAYAESRTPGTLKGTFDATGNSGDVISGTDGKLLFIGQGTGWTGTLQIRLTEGGVTAPLYINTTLVSITGDAAFSFDVGANVRVDVACTAFTGGTYSFILKR